MGLSRVSQPTLPFLSLPSRGLWIHQTLPFIPHPHQEYLLNSGPLLFCFFFGITLYSHTTVSPPVRQPLAICSDNLQASGTFLHFWSCFSGLICLVCCLSFSRPDRGRWRLAVTVTEALLLRAEGCSPFFVHALRTCACVGGCMYCVMLCCYVCDRKLDVLSYVSGSWLGRAGGLARGCWLRCRDGDRCYFGFAAFLQTHELFNNTCPFSSTRMARQ